MKRIQVSPARGAGFEPVGRTARSQAATMVLDPGGATGGPENRHPDADQWLYVASGFGLAVVEGESVHLEPGTLLLIEANERHEIRNPGDEPLRTVNVYAPPEY